MGLGVPKLRALFLEAFGHHTASNNGAWLRRKLCEAPDAQRGRGRSAAVRKRDQGAAIWTTGTVRNITQARCMPGCTVHRIPAHSLLCWQCADAWLAWPVESSATQLRACLPALTPSLMVMQSTHAVSQHRVPAPAAANCVVPA